MLRQAIFIAQPNCRIRLKEISDQLQDFRERLTEIAAGGQLTRQTIQGSGTFFAAALGLFTFVQLRCQMADDNGDNKVRAEHHEVLELADVKSEARRNEQKIPEQRAKGGEKKRRPAAQSHSGEDDCEQIEERDRPVVDEIDDRAMRNQ